MIKKPIIIIGAPRSGTTILFRTLAQHEDLWHLPTESHSVLEGPFKPNILNNESNRVRAEMLDDKLENELLQNFYTSSINLNHIYKDVGNIFSANSVIEKINHKIALQVAKVSKLKKTSTIRFLEKTPKNSLRVSMMDKLFPDAIFVWLIREPLGNIRSIYKGWHASEKVGILNFSRYSSAGYPVMSELELTDTNEKMWRFLLPPHWESLKGKTTVDAAIMQYYSALYYAHKDFKDIDPKRIIKVDYKTFVDNPQDDIKKILNKAELNSSIHVDKFIENLPKVNESKTLNKNAAHDDIIQDKIDSFLPLKELMEEIHGKL